MFEVRYLPDREHDVLIVRTSGAGDERAAEEVLATSGRYYDDHPEVFDMAVLSDMRDYFGVFSPQIFRQFIVEQRARRVSLGLPTKSLKPQVYLLPAGQTAVILNLLYGPLGMPPSVSTAESVEDAWTQLGHQLPVPDAVQQFLSGR